MATRKKPIIEEVIVEATLPLSKGPVTDDNTNFDVTYDSDTQTVFLTLKDGTAVEITSPKAKQFLLLESFVKSAAEEYKTDSFVMIKLASLCITKYGEAKFITFDNLLDNLEIEDLERLVAGLTFFRDKLEYLTGRASNI